MPGARMCRPTTGWCGRKACREAAVHRRAAPRAHRLLRRSRVSRDCSPLAVAAAAATTGSGSLRVSSCPASWARSCACADSSPLPDDCCGWIPTDISQGQLSVLTHARRAGDGQRVRCCTAICRSSSRSQAAGYTVRCFAYDWRRDITESGRRAGHGSSPRQNRRVDLARDRSQHGRPDRHGSRCARSVGARIQRLITLGTPHGGSYAPRCWRCAACIRWCAAWRRSTAAHGPRRSRAMVFSSFHSLYQMLPTLEGSLDLIDAAQLARTGPQPNASAARDRGHDAADPAGRIRASAPSQDLATKPCARQPHAR